MRWILIVLFVTVPAMFIPERVPGESEVVSARPHRVRCSKHYIARYGDDLCTEAAGDLVDNWPRENHPERNQKGGR